MFTSHMTVGLTDPHVCAHVSDDECVVWRMFNVSIEVEHRF